MPRTADRPPAGAERVETYGKLNYLLDGWAQGEVGFLAIVGPPGTAKSTAAEGHLGDRACVLRAGATPYRLYQEAFAHRDQLLLLDDVDPLLRSAAGLHLLLLLADTRPVKRLQYNAATAEIRRGDLPDRFETRSRVALLGNRWPAHAGPLESRGHLVHFDPPPGEVHRYVGTWFEDREVYDFVGRHLPLLDRPDCRVYRKARERKELGARRGRPEEWKEFVRGQLLRGPRLEAMRLLLDAGYRSDRERAAEFRARTGLSERTFYRHAKVLGRRLAGEGAGGGPPDEAGPSTGGAAPPPEVE